MSAPVLAFRNTAPPLKNKKQWSITDEDIAILLRAYELNQPRDRATVARVLLLGLPLASKRTEEQHQLAADLADIAQEYDPPTQKGGAR